MKLKKFFIMVILAILITSFIACWNTKIENNSDNLTVQEKLEDFQYLYKIIKDNYPFLEVNKRLHGVDWLSNKIDYMDSIKNTKNDEMFFDVLSEILKKLNNKDTQMINKNNINNIIDIYSTGKNINTYNYILNNPIFKSRYEKYIDSDNNSRMDSISKNNFNNVVTKDIVSGKIGYLSINQMLDTNSEFMDNDINIIDNYLDKIKNYNSLVIDIRGNNGGNKNYWEKYLVPRIIANPLVYETYSFYKDGDLIKNYFEDQNIELKNFSKIKDLNHEDIPNAPKELFRDFKYFNKQVSKIEPRNSINFNGRIYLLVDKNVMGASEAFTLFAQQTSFATIIGESTGGMGIGEQPIIGMLPNSGFIFTFPKEMGTTKDGTCNIEHILLPDYEVANVNKTKDFASDQCIEKVLELEGLNIESTLYITNKEFKFLDTTEELTGYEKENITELYILLSKLLNEYNGEITSFGDSENITYKFKKQYSNENSISLKYKKPMKLSIQSKSKSIPMEYRDKFHNVTLEVTDINISWIPDENMVLVNLVGKKKALVIEFFDNVITDEFVKLHT